MPSRRIRIAVSTVFLFAPALAIGADTLESVEKTIIARSRDVSSLQFDMKTVADYSSAQFSFTQNSQGRYEYLKKGDKMLYRIESKDRSVTKTGETEKATDSATTIIFDGSFLYSLRDTDGKKSATKQKAPNSGWFADQAYFDTMKRSYDLKLLPDETVEGRAVYVIEAKGKAVGAPPTSTIMYHDKETGLAIKTVTKDGSGKVTSTSTFSNLNINPPISPDRFTFELPPGVELVDLTQSQQGQARPSQQKTERTVRPKDASGADDKGKDAQAEEEESEEAKKPEKKKSKKRGLFNKLKKRKFP